MLGVRVTDKCDQELTAVNRTDRKTAAHYLSLACCVRAAKCNYCEYN